MNPTIIVLDGEQRAALAVVRSLGAHGCVVHVGSSVPRSIAGGSRYAASENLLPDPMASAESYRAAVLELLRSRPAQVLIPVTEASTLALLERPELFRDIVIPGSDLAHFRHASDKEAVLALAASVAIDVPAQWTATGAPDGTPTIPLAQFPVVIKPARSVVGDQTSRRKVTVRYAASPDELTAVLSQLGPETGPHLIQARVEGPGVGVFLLRWNGHIVATFAHRRIREKPPSGGVSTVCESVAPDAELIARSAALLDALDWTGVAMVEFKHDTRSGRTCLMEINARFWGSLQLAIDAGVDFPWLLVQLALGRSPAPVREWHVGLRSRWWWGDIDHLVTRLRHSSRSLDLPSNVPGLPRVALQILTPWRPRQQNDVFRLSDPTPGLRESIAWLRALI